MVDDRLLSLLHDCDQYLARQQVLIDRATALGTPPYCAVAMDAAMDQLSASVRCTWRLLLADARGSVPGVADEHGHGTEPGE